tara:strand:- start:2605 stop:3108 length:504 start_codon:yes stop_codon:yes gene_type:complete
MLKPWMHPSEIELIKSYLNPTDIMLEWGSGGSTMLFPQYVSKYYSIEHKKEWFDKIKHQLKDSKVNLNYVPPEVDNPVMPSKKEDYFSYISYPSILNKKYDKILIDGRARQFCAEYCISFLKDEGLVFFHDFWMKGRERYKNITFKYYNEVASITTTHQTLIVLKPK